MDNLIPTDTTTPLPLMVAPLRVVVPLTTSDEFVNDETQNTTTPDAYFGALVPYVDSNNNSCVDDDAGPSNVSMVQRRPGRPKGSTNTRRPSIPIMDAQLEVIVPNDDSNNNPSDDAVGLPSNPPVIKRGRGRPNGSTNSEPKKKKVEISDPNRRLVKSCPNFDSGITEAEIQNGNHELVELVLMRFDAIRRRFSQLENVTGLLTGAAANCTKLGVRTNKMKRIGPVPGVEVGNIFYFWGEMCLVGLHLNWAAGIDYIKEKDGAPEGGLATSVVTSGRYDDKTSEINSLVYTGQVSKDKNGVDIDQKLENGNLALKTSHELGSEVRVIRGVEYPRGSKKMIYLYDGLYNVETFTKRMNEKGFEEFKFTLLRKSDQPSGFEVWKEVENLKFNGLNNPRKGLILGDISYGKENLPVPLVNEVDENDKALLESFEYQKSSLNCSWIMDLNMSFLDSPLITCTNCVDGSCSSKDKDCVCVERNGGFLPFYEQFLVCRRPMVYECGELCCCPLNCKNRVVKAGLKLRLEVLKTKNCGWRLRSSEPIRTGTFICEFSGIKMGGEAEENNEYVFDTSMVYKRFKWNYEPELVGEDVWQSVPEVFKLTSHMLINAKNHGNIGRFMNHSCSPNVFWQPIEMVQNGEMHFYIAFFAKKHIPPLTELRYDYGASVKMDEIGEDGARVFKGKNICLCGSVTCRGCFG